MIATPLQQDATCPRHWRLPIQATHLRRVTDDVERGRQFRENTSGAASRFRRHHSSISRICASASGVVCTGRLTGADAARRELPTLVEAVPPQRIPKTRTALRVERGAPRRSGHHPRRPQPGRQPSPRAGWLARPEPAVPSERVLGEDSYEYCTGLLSARQASRGATEAVDFFAARVPRASGTESRWGRHSVSGRPAMLRVASLPSTFRYHPNASSCTRLAP